MGSVADPSRWVSEPRPGVRKGLSADGLYTMLKRRFDGFPDMRREGCSVSLGDACMSAFAMFLLKDPSLLSFDQRRQDANMRQLFRIGQIPCDTQMRTILDKVDPVDLRPAFNDVFRELQRGKVLCEFRYLSEGYLLCLDGTGYFSSKSIHCANCLDKTDSKTGETTYSHQMLGAAIVHPDRKEVIAMAPEPIIKQDGSTKNDCERNAAKRLLERMRREHPHLSLVVTEDGLASNAPHIRDLLRLDMHFILGAKPGDHAFLFNRLIDAFEDDRVITIAGRVKSGKEPRRYEIAYVNQVPLNQSNQDLLVNVLQYFEYDEAGNVVKQFSWVTDIRITRGNAEDLMRAGRSRWKIENETFNTLKNQGYHFEHNYGHGEENLSVVFAMLMMLAFLVNQVEQACCPLFQAILTKVKSKRALWETIRSHYAHFVFESMQHLYEVILWDLALNLPAPKLNSS